LPENAKELVIDPDNATSCQAEYRVGKKYLMFATKTLVAGECSGSRPIEWASEDIEFLEHFAKGQTVTRVYGKALQWLGAWGPTSEDEEAPAAGALVKLQSETNRWEGVAGPNGAFSFDGIAPGRYLLSAGLESFTPSVRPQEIDVLSRGCVEQSIELRSKTDVAGVILDYLGNPAASRRVEVRRRNFSGHWYGTYEFWRQSDRNGRFKFENIPTGDYLLGYEIAQGGPGIESAEPTTYFPGVAEQKSAVVLHLEPNQKISDLKFRLGRPQTPRQITVLVAGPDGKPPGDHLLQVFANEELLRNLGGLNKARSLTTAGRLTFTGYEERQYRLSARYWVNDLGDGAPVSEKLIETTGVSIVGPGTGPVVVRPVLGSPKLSDN
jgi:hypothetical protein